MRSFVKRIALVTVAAAMGALLVHWASFVYREAKVQMALSEGRSFQPPKSSPPWISRDPPVALRQKVPSHAMPDPKFDGPAAAALKALAANDCDQVIAIYTEMLKTSLTPDYLWLFLTRRGDCYMKRDQPEKALADYDEAARLGGLTSAVRVSRASALIRLGRRDDAFREFDAALASEPDDPMIYSARAEALAQQGELDPAIQDYRRALTIDPRNVALRLACAAACLRRDRNYDAIVEATKAMQIDRASYRAYIARADAFAQLGMFRRANQDLDTVETLRPADRVSALNSLAWQRAKDPYPQLRNGDKAMTEATEACDLDHGKHWSYIDTLAACYAERGAFDDAGRYEQLAIQMATTEKRSTRELEQRLRLYQQHHAYHED